MQPWQVACLAWDRDGCLLATSNGTAASVWGAPARARPGCPADARPLCASLRPPAHRRAASAAARRQLVVHAGPPARRARRLPQGTQPSKPGQGAPTRTERGCAAGRNGRALAAGGAPASVACCGHAPRSRITALAFQPDGGLLVRARAPRAAVISQ